MTTRTMKEKGPTTVKIIDDTQAEQLKWLKQNTGVKTEFRVRQLLGVALAQVPELKNFGQK